MKRTISRMFCLNCWKIFIVPERKFSSFISSLWAASSVLHQAGLRTLFPSRELFNYPKSFFCLVKKKNHDWKQSSINDSPSKVFSCGTVPTLVALIAKSNSQFWLREKDKSKQRGTNCWRCVCERRQLLMLLRDRHPVGTSAFHAAVQSVCEAVFFCCFFLKVQLLFVSGCNYCVFGV